MKPSILTRTKDMYHTKTENILKDVAFLAWAWHVAFQEEDGDCVKCLEFVGVQQRNDGKLDHPTPCISTQARSEHGGFQKQGPQFGP